MRCARSWQSNAIFARAIIIKPASNPVLPAQRFASSRRSFLVRRRRFCSGERNKTILSNRDLALYFLFTCNQTLQQMGYTDVVSIAGGFNEWSKQGLPTRF